MSNATSVLAPGTTVYLLRGSKYAGVFHLATVTHHEGEWFAIVGTDRCEWFTREADAFTTEAEARAAAKARRKPRQARTARPLYGDFALLAQFHGIATDGTGRVAR